VSDELLQPESDEVEPIVEAVVAEPVAVTDDDLAVFATPSDDLAVIPKEPVLVNPSRLTEPQRKEAEELAAKIDPDDAQSVLAFGMKPQGALAAATEQIIGKTQTSASGDAGATLTDLLDTLKASDMDSLTGQLERFIRAIPIIGGFFSEAQQIISAYEPIANKITKIEGRLHEQQMVLLTDYENLNRMFGENSKFIGLLEVYIGAGNIKIEELRRKLAVLQADPEASTDGLKAQAIDDARRGIERLASRVYDLELTRMIAIQTGPQIRLIQDGNERLATKIHTAVLTTIPLWKGQVALAISLAHQREAVDAVKGVTDATNEMLRRNSEVLKQGTIDVRRETARGVVDIETLQLTTANLITTVEEALRISEEGRAKRAEGEKAIAEMEQRIKSALADKQRELAAY
jgi:uncharacterized protein YaaN involved in tellurite resistance